MEIKQELYNQCQKFIEARLNTVQNTIKDIQQSLLSETKSSAGDKHEKKAGQQLAEIQKTTLGLTKIDTSKTSKTISLGSIVYTSQANYFIAISAGIINYKDEKFYAISVSTPIAQLLLSKSKGDKISFRANNFSITNVI